MSSDLFMSMAGRVPEDPPMIVPCVGLNSTSEPRLFIAGALVTSGARVLVSAAEGAAAELARELKATELPQTMNPPGAGIIAYKLPARPILLSLKQELIKLSKAKSARTRTDKNLA